MRGVPEQARLAVVTPSGPVRVVLDIEHTDGTISGRLAVDRTHAGHFHGWLELIDRIERAINRESATAVEPPAQARGGR